MSEQVILVDQNDNEIGQAEKLYAHENAMLHRAFSIFIYRLTDGKIEYLLQKRNKDKYHSGGLWTNTCCGHPRPGENLSEAVVRRLKEEVGIHATLSEIGKYYYKADVGNNLTEHEIDKVYVGQWTGDQVNVDPSEIEDYKWISPESLEKQFSANPNEFTVWFGGVYNIVKNYAQHI